MAASDKTSVSLPAGTRLVSPQYTYTIEKVVGAGGFGITYQAWATIKVQNIEITTRFAIKEHFIGSLCGRESTRVVYSDPVSRQVEGSLKDFISEARRLQSLGVSHPNIVKVNEVFEANNTAYYIMEYLEGESLRNYVANCGGKLSAAEMLGIMTPILNAVKVLHANRLTHLDIKPDNIMVTRTKEGALRPVLIDFGLAKHYDAAGSPTSTINTLGCSAGYSPIEQYVGISTFSPTADIYALGATMLYCLSGNTPRKASEITPADIDSAIPADTPLQVRHAIRAAMTHSAADRIPSVDAMLRQLGAPSEATEPVEPQPAKPTPTQPLSQPKKSAVPKGLIITFSIFVLIFICMVIYENWGRGGKAAEEMPVGEMAVEAIEPFSLVCENNGEISYFTESEWNNLSSEEQSRYDKLGVYVVGNGEEFVLSLYDNGDEMTWDGAMLCYGDALPTKAQAEVMADNYEAINSAIIAFGGDEDPEHVYWTQTEDGSSLAWLVDMYSGNVGFSTRSNASRVRTVAAVPDSPEM